MAKRKNLDEIERMPADVRAALGMIRDDLTLVLNQAMVAGRQMGLRGEELAIFAAQRQDEAREQIIEYSFDMPDDDKKAYDGYRSIIAGAASISAAPQVVAEEATAAVAPDASMPAVQPGMPGIPGSAISMADVQPGMPGIPGSATTGAMVTPVTRPMIPATVNPNATVSAQPTRPRRVTVSPSIRATEGRAGAMQAESELTRQANTPTRIVPARSAQDRNREMLRNR